MRDVINFNSVQQIKESLGLIKKESLIISATSDFSDKLSNAYKENEFLKFRSAKKFVSYFIPEWEDTIKDIKNYVRIRNVVEDYVTNESKINQETATYLRRNTSEMWNAIVLLIEADVYPADIADYPIYMYHFKNIWTKLELENPQILEFRSKMKFGYNDSKSVKDVFVKNKLSSKAPIYLVGFYFITPVQNRIIDILEKSGYKIVFLNCNNQEYGYMNEIWSVTFPESDYQIRQAKLADKIENPYGEALKTPNSKIPCQIYNHENTFEFADMVKKAFDKKELIYSPNSKESEKILREFYPEYFKDKHLLSYPVGQYIYYLHMLWDSFDNRLSFNFDYVFQCFASGWLIDNNLNGKDYLKELSILGGYFENCKSADQWHSFIHSLKKAKVVTEVFENEKSKSNRWHKVLGNPLRKIGIHTLPIHSIENIEKLFNKLKSDAMILFSKNEKVDLYDHFTKIKSIIENKITSDRDKLLKDEKDIVNALIFKLSDDSVKNIICPLNGIKDAILLLVNSNADNNQSFSDKMNSSCRMVSPIEMIESAAITENVKKVHLVLADEFSLPGKPTDLPWPLDMNVIDKIIGSVSEKRRKYISALKSIVLYSPVSNRYLFFTFMGLQNVELCVEWISRKDKKDIGITPFVSLFKYTEDSNEKNIYENELIESTKRIVPQKNIKPVVPTGVPDDIKMDYILCKSRYLYSYIFNEYPSFTSNFHYSFLLSKMIASFSKVSGLDKELIAKELSELFPFFRDVELRQSADYVSLKGELPPIYYDEVEYPGDRLKIHYLHTDIINYCESIIENNINDDVGIEEPDNKCMYCPYSDLCMDRYNEGDN